ncbi:MAG: RnfH family protein [Ideonella sp.]|nr:RnfH family protein [Ideonella sp.]MCC7456810.1 RnfH family protein [Nitrospira sp.]
MASAELAIEVVVALAPHCVRCATLRLPAGATVADALRASGVLDGVDGALVDALAPSVWSRAVALDARLRDGDRVELTRPLRVDPKEARRQRYRRDGVRRKVSGSPTR